MIFNFLYFFVFGFCVYPINLFSNESVSSIINPQYIVDKYNQADCCILVDQLEVVQLDRRSYLDIDLYESGHLVELSTGPTFATLVKLPLSKNNEKYEIVTSVMNVHDDMHVFFPYIAFLDENFKLIATSDFTLNKYFGKSLFRATGQLIINFELDATSKEDEKVKYLLIYTRKKHFTSKSNNELIKKQRNIQLNEVSIEYADSTETYIDRDILYGLPGGMVTIRNIGFW